MIPLVSQYKIRKQRKQDGIMCWLQTNRSKREFCRTTFGPLGRKVRFSPQVLSPALRGNWCKYFRSKVSRGAAQMMEIVYQLHWDNIANFVFNSTRFKTETVFHPAQLHFARRRSQCVSIALYKLLPNEYWIHTYVQMYV